jgi:hypothetical protein
MDIPGIYAVTAANPSESSYARWCGSSAKINGRSMGTCLGDHFTGDWLADSENHDITLEPLDAQYQSVRKSVSQSHVMRYGDTSFKNDVLSEYQSNADTPAPTPTPSPSPTPTPTPGSCHAISTLVDDDWCEANCAQGFCPSDLCEDCDSNYEAPDSKVSVRQVELFQAQYNYVHAATGTERLARGAELRIALKEQLAAEAAYLKFLELVYPGDAAKQAAAREAQKLPNDKDCELPAHDNFQTYGTFDATSGFAMQFHQWVVNVCADVAASGSNFDVAEAAKQACLGDHEAETLTV